MDMATEAGVLLAYALGIMALYIICYIFIVPIKVIGKLCLNSLLGGIAIIMINLIGGNFGIHMNLNIISATIVGILGVPGLIMLQFFQ